MKPDISVVIPLYNKEKYIQRAIRSVLLQTIHNLECIIVDSSTDRSTDLVKEYSDPRIVHVPCKKSTAARARNTGVQIAQSDFIAFLDADDEWQPDHIETLLSLRNNFPDAGLYSTPYVKLKPDGNPMVMLFVGIPPPPWDGYIENYLRICSRGDEPVHSSSCAVPRDIFEKMGGFPENLKYGEDQFLWNKISMAYPVAYSWKGLAIYHTEALGRICNETHVIEEHPFSTHIRKELAAGTIPPEKLQECKAYIRRKRYSEFFSTLIMGKGTTSCRGPIAQESDSYINSHGDELKAKGSMKIIDRFLNRFYHSSVHDFIRRCLCKIYGCYDPGTDLTTGKRKQIP